MRSVAPRSPVVSTVRAASSGSFSGFLPGESTVLRVRLKILLTCCVSGVIHDVAGACSRFKYPTR